MTDGERMAALERTVDHLREDVREMCAALDIVERHITILTTQRDDSDKRLSRWKTGAISLLGGAALTGFLWIAKIAMIVQASKVQP